MLRLSLCLRLAKVAFVICLVFRVGGCVMVIRLAFHDYELPFLWLAVLNFYCDCDCFVFGHAIVIHPMCLALRDCDSLVGWRAIFIRFLCCDCKLPILSGRIVICLLLRDDDSLGWLDRLLVDNCFLLQLRCARDS